MDAFETRLKKMNKKIDSVIDKLTMCNSQELTKDFTEIEKTCLIGALSAKLAAHNLFLTHMKLQHVEWVVATELLKELYAKHLEIGLYSDLNYLWCRVQQLLNGLKTVEERTSCAQGNAPDDAKEAQKLLTTGQGMPAGGVK
jgi:hypothetical protein